MCRFGREVGFAVVAEHVERLEELAVLRDAGVAYAEGFYFGTPSPTWQPEIQDHGWAVGADSEYGRLHDVLLCPPDNFRWLPTSAAAVPGRCRHLARGPAPGHAQPRGRS